MKNKLYTLISSSGQTYQSEQPGVYGGHKILKIYGRLDCLSASSWLKKGQYKQHRVFFASEQDAIDAGYRPCGICLREKYLKWKASSNACSKSL